MEATNETKRTVTLVLDEAEAAWLKGIVQNPFCGQSQQDEELRDKEMRGKFWHALGGR